MLSPGDENDIGTEKQLIKLETDLQADLECVPEVSVAPNNMRCVCDGCPDCSSCAIVVLTTLIVLAALAVLAA